MGLGTTALTIYAALNSPKILTMVIPMTLAGYVFAFYFVRPLPGLLGAEIRIDEQGLTWLRGGQTVHLAWGEVRSLGHGRFDHDTWQLSDGGNRRIAVGPYWFGSRNQLPLLPIRELVERSLPSISVPETVQVKPHGTIERMILFSASGLGAAFLVPLGIALFMPYASYVPIAARITVALLIGIILFALGRGIWMMSTSRIEVSADRMVLREGLRENVHPLDEALEIRNEDAELRGLPVWKTTVQFPDQTIVLTSRQNGYFAARALLSRAGAR